LIFGDIAGIYSKWREEIGAGGKTLGIMYIAWETLGTTAINLLSTNKCMKIISDKKLNKILKNNCF